LLVLEILVTYSSSVISIIQSYLIIDPMAPAGMEVWFTKQDQQLSNTMLTKDKCRSSVQSLCLSLCLFFQCFGFSWCTVLQYLLNCVVRFLKLNYWCILM